jgi:hypothetical protein
MPIAPPDLLEFVPTSSAVNPSLSFPSDFTADQILFKIDDAGIVEIFPFCTTVFIFRSGILFSGMFVVRILLISSRHARTGHIIFSPILSFDFWCVIVSSLMSRFCHSNVIDTEVAVDTSSESWLSNFFPRLKKERDGQT